MSLAGADLSTDPEGLRALAAALRAELAEKDLALAARDAELHAKTLHIEKLRAELAVLRRARFGRSSEGLDRAIDQLELAIGDLEEGEAEREARTAAAGRGGSPTAKRRDRRPPGVHSQRYSRPSAADPIARACWPGSTASRPMLLR